VGGDGRTNKTFGPHPLRTCLHMEITLIHRERTLRRLKRIAVRTCLHMEITLIHRERTLRRLKRIAVLLLYGRRTSVVGFAEPALSRIGQTPTHSQTLPRGLRTNLRCSLGSNRGCNCNHHQPLSTLEYGMFGSGPRATKALFGSGSLLPRPKQYGPTDGRKWWTCRACGEKRWSATGMRESS